MTAALSTNAKYFIQLMKTATLETFIEEARTYFATQIPKDKVYVTKESGFRYGTTHTLATDLQAVADEFPTSPLAAEFGKRAFISRMELAVEIPFFWGVGTFSAILESIRGQKPSIDPFNWLEGLMRRSNEYQYAFWDSFFKILSDADMLQHDEPSAVCISRTSSWFSYCMASRSEELHRSADAFAIFLRVLARAVLPLIEQKTDAEDFQGMFQRIYEMVDFHPYFYTQLIYPLNEKISKKNVERLVAELLLRARSVRFFISWPLLQEACSSLNSAVFSRRDTQFHSFAALMGHLTSIGEIAEIAASRATEKTIPSHCPMLHDSSHPMSKESFMGQVFGRGAAWQSMAEEIPITRENLGEFVQVQCAFYSSHWNKQFEKVTEESLRLCLDYVDQVDAAIKAKKKTWPREEVLKLVANSDLWKTYPIDGALDIEKRMRSRELFLSILKRPEEEFPIDLLHLRFVYEVAHNARK